MLSIVLALSRFPLGGFTKRADSGKQGANPALQWTGFAVH
jgi:hypothetical protein